MVVAEAHKNVFGSASYAGKTQAMQEKTRYSGSQGHRKGLA